MLCKNGQARKAEQLLNDSASLDLSSFELLTCYNLVLWGWSRSDDASAAEQSERLLKSMTVKPTVSSYKYTLEAWSRTKAKRAGQRAEELLRIVQRMGLNDQWAAYHFALKACAKSREGDRAVRLLNEMLQREKDATGEVKVNKHILGTVLLAFKSMPTRAEAVLDNLEAKFGIQPDIVHYGIVLDACAAIPDGPRTEALFKKMLAKGFQPSVNTCNSLLHAWRGNIEYMEQLFQAMVTDYMDCHFQKSASSRSDDSANTDNNNTKGRGDTRVPLFAAVRPNVVGLSYVLTAQAQANAPDRSEALLAWVMNDARISSVVTPNIHCWTSVLNAWARVEQPERAEGLLRRLQQSGFEANTVTYTTVMHAWASAGNPERAHKLFNELVYDCKLQPNRYTLNVLIMAYAKAKQPQAAREILRTLPEECNVTPDIATYASVLRAWELSRKPKEAREFLEEIRLKEKQENDVLLDVVSYNTVLSAYSKAGMLGEAEELLAEMTNGNCGNIRPDAKSFALGLLGFTRSKDPRHRKEAGAKAEEAFDQMQILGVEPNAFVLNVGLQCFAASGNPQRAEDTLKNMIQSGIEIDVTGYNTCLNAWARVGNAERTEQLFLDLFVVDDEQIDSSPPVEPGQPKFNPIKKIDPDIRSFTIILLAWAKQNTIEAAEHAEGILRVMEKMEKVDCKPDTVAYNTALRAWLNAALASNSVDISSECGERAEILLTEMELLAEIKDMDHQSQEQRPNHRRVIGPDRISYSTVIQIWRAAGNDERKQIVMDRSNTLK